MTGLLSRHPRSVVIVVLLITGIATWLITDYIENVVRPRQQLQRLALIDDQIAQAHQLFKRNDYEIALQEYQFVLSAYSRYLPDELSGALHDWIGGCHAALAQTKQQEQSYRDAIESFDQALQFRSAERDLAGHVASTLHRGQALQGLAALKADSGILDQAVTTYQAALDKIRTTDMVAELADTHRLLGNTYRDFYQLDPQQYEMQPALEQYELALAKADARQYPEIHGATLQDIGRAYVDLAELKYRRRYLEDAVGHFEQALDYYDIEGTPRQHAETQLLIGDTYTLLAATKPKSRSDRAAHQQRVIRYEFRAKKAYRIAQSFGLTPNNGAEVENPVSVVDAKK